MPLAPHDMAPRDYLGLSGWPIERADLDRYVPEIERLFRLDQSSYEELPASPLNPNDSLLGGRPHMIPRWSKWPTFRRRNVAHLLRDMVVIKRDAEIWLNATVCDVLFDAASAGPPPSAEDGDLPFVTQSGQGPLHGRCDQAVAIVHVRHPAQPLTQIDRREHLVGPLRQHLVDAHERGDRGDPERAVLPAVSDPEVKRLEDRVPVVVRSHAGLSMDS